VAAGPAPAGSESSNEHPGERGSRHHRERTRSGGHWQRCAHAADDAGGAPMIFESVRLAFNRLGANAARSALTVLGVIIGVGSVVTLVAVGRGSAADVNDQFSGLGANTLTVTSGRGFGRGRAGAAGSANSLKLTDLAALQKLSTVAAVAPVIQTQQTITAAGTSVQSPVKGTTPTLMGTDHLAVAAGTFFSNFAEARKLPLAVLGATLTTDLGLTPRSAIGATLTVGPDHFVVVGVLQAQGQGFSSEDDSLLVPMSSLVGRLVSGSTTVNQFRIAATTAGTVNSRYRTDVTNALRTAHGLAASANNDFVTIDPTTLIQARQASSTNFTRLITAIAAISLVVGGIGVANVMLVAVRERTHEIGIRRAIGARRRDVIAQFLTEATVLSILGGLLGVAGGLGLTYALPHITGQRTIASYPAAALALAISALVGIIAGIGPANQAAGLDPADALRYE
jgi:putative ABC transport system permease protein